MSQTSSAIPPRLHWTRTVCKTLKRFMPQTGFGSADAKAWCSRWRVLLSRTLLIPKPPPRKLSQLPQRRQQNKRPPPPQHRQFRKLKKKRPRNPSLRYPLTLPFSRLPQRCQRNLLRLLNLRRRRPHLWLRQLPEPSQFQAPLRNLFHRKRFRRSTSNFRTP